MSSHSSLPKDGHIQERLYIKHVVKYEYIMKCELPEAKLLYQIVLGI